MKNKRKSTPSKNRLSLLALEPRMVFDGALDATASSFSDRDSGLNLTAMVEAATKAAAEDLANDTKVVSNHREIVFVDSALSDLQGLLAGIGSNADIVQQVVNHPPEQLALSIDMHRLIRLV